MFIQKNLLLKIILWATFVESIVALCFLALIPSDIKNGVLFGFSTSRLILMSGICALALLSFISLLMIGRIAALFELVLSDPGKTQALSFFCALMVGVGIFILLVPAQRMGEAAYQRLSPLAGLITLVGFQLFVAQFVWTGKHINRSSLVPWKKPLQFAGWTILFFLILWIFVVWSGIGIQPDPGRWSSPGTPLLFQQVLFAWMLGAGVIVLSKRIEHYKRLDFFISAAMWLSAVLIWWLEPMLRWSYFTPKPTAPNFEYYPYSDAMVYDRFAQNILIGASRQFGMTHRPLYSIFLSFLHVLGGQKFDNIIFLQILFFAIIPVFMYLLVSKLGGRAAGIIAALIVILRERNSITLTNVIEVSHLKLLMSDVPTMAMVMAFVYFFVIWLQDREQRMYLGVLAGAFFGFAVLVRSQVQLLIPVALFGFAMAGRFNWKTFLQRSLVFILSFLVVVTPWVIRNYQVSGLAVVEYQPIYTKQIASSYSTIPGEIEIRPNESKDDYDARMKKIVVDYMLGHPLDVARFYTSYFIHNEILSVVTLPMSLRFLDLYAYVDALGFWKESLGSLPGGILLIFFITLCFIAVGIGVAYHRFKWIGLMPLLFHLGYSLSVVPVRLSGWRYILPVDWVAFVYFSIGLAQLSVILFALISQKQREIPEISEFQENHSEANWTKVGGVFLGFAIIGLLFPIVEWSIPERYPELTRHEMIQTYMPNGFVLDNGDQVGASSLETFLETDPAATVLYGRALYPQYYLKGKFWGESSGDLIEASQYNRIQFEMIGPMRGFAFLPLEQAPQYFPHASDVFAVGCNRNGAVQVLAIKVNDRLMVSSDWHGLNCSVVE